MPFCASSLARKHHDHTPASSTTRPANCFLQKVGGGYIFVHRYRWYFAFQYGAASPLPAELVTPETLPDESDAHVAHLTRRAIPYHTGSHSCVAAISFLSAFAGK